MKLVRPTLKISGFEKTSPHHSRVCLQFLCKFPRYFYSYIIFSLILPFTTSITGIVERTPLRLHLQDTHFILHHLLIHLKVPAESSTKLYHQHFPLLLFTIWLQVLQILELERSLEFRSFKQSKVLCHHTTKETAKI